MLIHWLAMGGYGIYIWPAYGITFFVFAINIFFGLWEKKQIRKIITEQINVMHHE